jgi:hypothetical protein
LQEEIHRFSEKIFLAEKVFFYKGFGVFSVCVRLVSLIIERQKTMPEKKKPTESTPADKLAKQLRETAEGLYYISETDAEISPFAGAKADAVTKENLLQQTGNKPVEPVEERDFAGFFARLTKIQDWFGDEEKQTAAKYARLKELLESNLKDVKVFKVGRIEIDIYIVGLDGEGNLAGIKTKAVET